VSQAIIRMKYGTAVPEKTQVDTDCIEDCIRRIIPWARCIMVDDRSDALKTLYIIVDCERSCAMTHPAESRHRAWEEAFDNAWAYLDGVMERECLTEA